MNVIITGASKGIGKAIAVKFAREGHHIFMCSRNAKNIEATAAEIRNDFAVNVKARPADLSVKEEVFSFADWCLQQGAPDILVNNAGIYLPGNAMDEPDGHMESIMNSNFYSAYHLTRKLLPSMINSGHGHIFNICSIASLAAYDGGGSYSISKFAMHGLTKNLRHELKPRGIKVTGVYPGAVHTDTWGDFDNSDRRIMEAKDVADMLYAAAMLSPQAVVDDIIMSPQLGEL